MKSRPKLSARTGAGTKAPKAAARARASKKALRRAEGRRGALSAKACETFFAALKRANPNPAGELEYRNPYTLLVAVVLSAQATDVGVNRATRGLFAQVDSPEKMLAFGEENLREAIRTIGLYRTKAKNVIALSELLLARHDGRVPEDESALTALPGVGRKTANVVRNIAFGAPVVAVDTHVFRVANRTGLAPGPTPDAVERALLKAVPRAYLKNAHHWLILHGRYICTARAPKCGVCPVRGTCLWPDKTA